MIGHVDGFNRHRNNYYLYHEPTTDKFFFIPWGADATFGILGATNGFLAEGPVKTIYTYPKLTRRLYLDPSFKSQYRKTMKSMLNERWNTTALLIEFDRMQSLTVGQILSPDSKYKEHVNSLRTWIEKRKDILLKELDENPRPLHPKDFELILCVRLIWNFTMHLTTKWGTFDPRIDPFAVGPVGNGTIFLKELKKDLKKYAVGAVAGSTTAPQLSSKPIGLIAGVVKLTVQHGNV
eukprot:TRINITY_DN285_c0_g1_i1.p1 TRINITY_DN285_c0_g1~~TRINITY_DN285_c0_g1_i1.p1  ORF type:complete len:236 (+),score=26.30 TRINITY_DN285_c0_g1_i1:663-1370(+)